jgi:hypothetical protein
MWIVPPKGTTAMDRNAVRIARPGAAMKIHLFAPSGTTSSLKKS